VACWYLINCAHYSHSQAFVILHYVSSKKGGNGGSSAETLRGTKGADFENEGRINRGSDAFGCGCSGGRKEDKDRYILIKGMYSRGCIINAK
jgi:hypothetical protein